MTFRLINVSYLYKEVDTRRKLVGWKKHSGYFLPCLIFISKIVNYINTGTINYSLLPNRNKEWRQQTNVLRLDFLLQNRV